MIYTMIYFTAHTLNCVCHSIRSMFRVLGVYNFGWMVNQGNISTLLNSSRISTLHTADGAQLKKVFEYANFQESHF